MNIVGLNFSIDSAAALLINGKRIAASQEERFSRIKHDPSFPNQALRFCLKQGGISAKDVDVFAFFWNPGRHIEPMLSRQSGSIRHHSEYLYSVPNHLLQVLGQPGVGGVEQQFILDGGDKVSVRYVEHHMAHAAAALFNSPFEEAALLTVDGYGERTASLIAHGRGHQITPVVAQEYPHSVGSFYAAVTQYLGFKANSGEGKVMGLASYGKDRYLPAMRELVRLTPEGFELDLSYFQYTMERTVRYSPRFVQRFGPARAPESDIDSRHEDVAYALQVVTEELLLHLARIAREKTGSKNLCFAGGVALNCVANRRLMLEAGFENLFILPPSGDAGSSLGAAQYVAHVLNNEPRDPGQYLDYLGFENTAAEIELAVQTSRLPSFQPGNVEQTAARLMAKGAILGWFQGRTEFGPRALGNRSIVTDPRPAEMKDTLNARVKFREPFRPFAPSCLQESCGELFDSAVPSPFMLRVYNTLPHRMEDLGAITHVDGGARVQTVTPEQNPRYYKLIQEFGKITGVNCILNTSFNIRGEPIVNTVREAIFCFIGTDMDYLVVGDHLLAKTPQDLEKAKAEEARS